jgi:hypothetical protein
MAALGVELTVGFWQVFLRVAARKCIGLPWDRCGFQRMGTVPRLQRAEN